MMVKKRKDECLFCSKKSCYNRIVRLAEPKYDEIACGNHILELEKHSDEALGVKNGIMRYHISGTSKQCRGKILN